MSTHIKTKLHYEEIEYYFHDFGEKQIINNKIYDLTEKLTNLAHPTYEEHDRRWEYFYIPVWRNAKIIAIPMWIMEYNKEFFVLIQSFGTIHIKKEENKENKDIGKIDFYRYKFYRNIFTYALEFVPTLKKDDRILNKMIPYDIRIGKIKGRYILENILSQEEKKKISENYKKHIDKSLQIDGISLNQYLDIASICYKAAYQHEAEKLSPIDMYKRWADGRDGGMLSIKDWNSKKEFYEWYHSGQYIGGHPFEIVFSWHQHGIHLYPPNDQSPYYSLRVTNYAYAQKFLEMINELIKKDIPFSAGKLDEVLDYLAGDTYFMVNRMGDHYFRYILSREYKQKYFQYIEWDDIKVVKWIR